MEIDVNTEEIEIKIEYNCVLEEDPLSDNSCKRENEFDFNQENENIYIPIENDCEQYVERKTTDKSTSLNYELNISAEPFTQTEFKCTNPSENPDSILLSKTNIPDERCIEQKLLVLWPACEKEKKSWSLIATASEKDRSESATWYRKMDVNGKLYCRYCDLSYNTVQTLRYHVRTKHPKEAASLKEKIAKLSRSHKLICHICEAKHLSLEQLKDHVLLKHNLNIKETFICDICLTMFYFKKKLKSHIGNVHFNQKIKSLESKTQCIMVGNRKYPCPHCDHVAKRKYGLKTHIKVKHKSEDDLIYTCPFCSYRASVKYYVQNHVTTKHPESDYARSKKCHFCDVCGYRTPRKSYFNLHRKSHFSDVKSHKCDVCDYATNLWTNLEVHKRTHTKEKPYACSVAGCGYRCSAKTALNSHSLKHDPERNAIYCDKCSYKTVYKHALKKHRELHDRKSHCNTNRKNLLVKEQDAYSMYNVHKDIIRR